MSLRVLLADESDTIKKVFQLALQDFNAEVKAVHSGLDVIDVAESFKPDILFADVLLQKKNGYQLCSELKQTNGLESTPVVLMWSSFMELDQGEYKKSGANGQLEKPFDADQLRALIQTHVPSAQDQEIGGFLEFPDNIKTSAEKPTKKVELSESGFEEESSEFNLDTSGGESSDRDSVDFSMPEPTDSSPMEAAPPEAELPKVDEEWSAKDLSKFTIDESSNNEDDDLEKFESLNLGETVINLPPPESTNEASKEQKAESPPPSFSMEENKEQSSSEDMSVASLDEIFANDHTSQAQQPATTNDSIDKDLFSLSFDEKSSPESPKKEQTTTQSKDFNIDGLSSEIEGIVRAHTEEILKKYIDKSLHQIMEKIIREELNKVLEEEIRLNQELNDGP